MPSTILRGLHVFTSLILRIILWDRYYYSTSIVHRKKLRLSDSSKVTKLARGQADMRSQAAASQLLCSTHLNMCFLISLLGVSWCSNLLSLRHINIHLYSTHIVLWMWTTGFFITIFFFPLEVQQILTWNLICCFGS